MAPNPAPDLLTFQTMYLCGVAYMPDPPLMPGMIEKTQVPPPGTAVWRCLWGPVQNDDDANLAFVAGYFPDPNAAPQSIFVTIRGTDVDVGDIGGIVWQVWEDLDADPQPMPWALNDPARVASGTLDGLTTIQGLADFTQPTNQETLSQFLTTFFANPANANVTTVVTGHSLGGCLASIVAVWIRAQLAPSGAIQPITWAAPTAGNSRFAEIYDQLFPSARRFQNTLDVVPLAYYGLGTIDGIYGGLLPAPDPVQVGLAIMQKALKDKGASYAQPAQGQQILTGSFCPADSTDWYAQALHQHHLATYLAILTGTPVDMAALPQPNAARARKARLLELIGSAGTASKGK
jgi:hypothetical protein